MGRLLQAGRLCDHRLQPWVWFRRLQPLLHHPPWETVSRHLTWDVHCPLSPAGVPNHRPGDFSFTNWLHLKKNPVISLYDHWPSLLLSNFLLRCRLSMGGKDLIIQTYTWTNSFYGDGKKFIGSAFPASPWYNVRLKPSSPQTCW